MVDIVGNNVGSSSNSFGKLVIWHTLINGSASDGSKAGSISGSYVYLALYNTIPTDYDTGTEVRNDWGGSVDNKYKRMEISGSMLVNMTTGSSGNHKTITFPTATGSWGNVQYWGIRNGSQSGGNSGSLLFWGSIGGFTYSIPAPGGPAPTGYQEGDQRTISLGRYVGQEETLSFSASNLQITLNGAFTAPLSGSLLNHYLNNVRLGGSSIPAWLGLYRLVTGTGGSSELTYSGYKRIIASGSGGWTGSWVNPSLVSTGCNITWNASNFVFTYNAPTEWKVDGAFIVSASLGGEILYKIPFSEQKTISASSGFMFSASSLGIQIS